MHYPPDLNLASSYLPACLCILKSMLLFLLFVLSPVRGWIGLCCLLALDRILWNHCSHLILDVNAVLFALAGGLMVMHARVDGVQNSVLEIIIVVLWQLVSASQIVGLSRLPRAQEIVFGACCVSMLSCFHQAAAGVEILALRTFVFVLFNVTLPYIGVMMQHEIDTYANISRTMPFYLSGPEASAAWLAIYLLCIGHQVRKRTQLHDDDEAPVIAVHKSPPETPEPSVDESVQLREALASRRKAVSD